MITSALLIAGIALVYAGQAIAWLWAALANPSLQGLLLVCLLLHVRSGLYGIIQLIDLTAIKPRG